MAASQVMMFKKLVGRQNYTTWKIAAKAMLIDFDLWDCVTGDEADPKKQAKAKAKLISVIDEINYIHVEEATTAKDAWTRLEKCFDDSGLTRKVGLLRKLINVRLETSESVENYVNEILSGVQQLRNVKFDISEEWVGALMLAGLSDDYKPMIMGLESSGIEITGDSIKSKLLQEVQMPSSSKCSALYGQSRHSKSFHKKTPSDKFEPRCFNCNKYGHYANKCPKPQKEKKSSKTNSSSEHFGLHSFFVEHDRNADEWFIDSGASMHMTMNSNWLYDEITPPTGEITVANNTTLAVHKAGKVNVNLSVNKSEPTVIHNVLHVPGLTANLLSVSQLVKKGYEVTFDSNGCNVKNANNKIIATGSLINGMFKLNCAKYSALMSTVKPDYQLWHRRMGHLNSTDLCKLKDGMATGIDYASTSEEQCISCIKGKHSRLPFKNSVTRTSKKLELIHSDLCGPLDTPSMGQAKYFVTFIDDFSRKVFVYFLGSKTGLGEVFETFKLMVENQQDTKIKILRTDNGSEYCNQQVKQLLMKSGIQHQTTVPYTPQQNGIAERMNKTIMDKARSMLVDANLSKEFWAEAVLTAVYLINRSPTKGLNGQTPEEAWSGEKPDLSNLHVFGCKAMVQIPKEKRYKLDPKSEEMIFTGYSNDTKGFRLINPKTKQLRISRDVVFIETRPSNSIYPVENSIDKSDSSMENDIGFIHEVNMDPVGASPIESLTDDSTSEPSNVDTTLNENSDSYSNIDDEYQNTSDSDDSSDFVDAEINAPVVPGSQENVRRSERTPKPIRMNDFVLYNVNVQDLRDPITMEEALSRSDSDCWRKAMDEEFLSLADNKTWNLVELPAGRNPIKNKWVFKTKRDSNGLIQRYKARLVAKGYSQVEGVDYAETFSPVVRYSSIRYLMAIAVKYNLDVQQMDAITAFLQGDLNEDLYMVQPEGYEQGDKVCQLKKAIYGLKQASRVWNAKLHRVLLEIGLKQSKLDPCVYFEISNEKILILTIYVDDFLIFSNQQTSTVYLKNELKQRFNMKDLGDVHNCVGLTITRDRQNGKIYIDQERYIEEILARFGMSDCKPVSVPFDCSQTLTNDMQPKSSDEVSEMSKIPYQAAVGSLLYLVQGTRPDIAYAVSTVSKYNNNYGKAHWAAVKRIFRYLRGTSKMKLEFSKNGNTNIIGYCDADWGSSVDDRRSCTGYVFKLQGGSVSWNSKRQPTVALSTSEAEYMALSSATQEAMWLKQFDNELWPDHNKIPILICCDNKGAIDLSRSDAFRARSKHIDIRHHFVREKVASNEIAVESIGTEMMTADVLTKGVTRIKHSFCISEMGLKIFNQHSSGGVEK